MLIKLLILAIFFSSNILSQIEYEVAALQAKQSQHLHKNLREVILLCFLIKTCVCDKEDLFNFFKSPNIFWPEIMLSIFLQFKELQSTYAYIKKSIFLLKSQKPRKL